MEEVIEMRDGFIIHEKTLKQMKRLDPADVGYLISCMSTYYTEGKIDIDAVAETSLVVAVILEDAVERMDADAKSYEKSVEQRRNAAKSRWNNTKECEDDAKECDRIIPQCEDHAKNAVSVSDSVSESKEKTSLTRGKRERFTPPTVDEVREYCLERKNWVDPEMFVDFYASKGWKVGKEPMKDWKAAVRTWEKKREEKPRSSPNKFANFPQRDDADHKSMIDQIVNMQLA